MELYATLRRDGWRSMALMLGDKGFKTERESKRAAIRRALPDAS